MWGFCFFIKNYYICKMNQDNIQYLKCQEPRSITLNEWVKAYYDCDIFSFPEDKFILIKEIAERTIVSKNSVIKEGRRINEQGNDTEDHLMNSIKEVLGGDFKTLGNAYPDIKGKSLLLDYPLIVDSKINKNLWEKDGMRIFYTSTPKKIIINRKKIESSYHLLFLFEHDGHGLLNGKYRVVDMNGFKYTAKGCLQEGSFTDILNHNKFIVENDRIK